MSLLAVTSGKGGTGKSCTAAYIALSLANKGKRVLLVECGFSFRSADIILSVKGDVLFDMADVLNNSCPVNKAVLKTNFNENLFVLPGPYSPLDIFSFKREFADVLTEAAALYDYVIADGIDASYVPLDIFDKVILVVTPDYLSVRANGAFALKLHQMGAKELLLVINKVPVKLLPMGIAQDLDDVIDITSAKLLGLVPYSPTLEHCSNSSQIISNDTLTANIFSNIADRLMGFYKKLLIR